MYIAAEWNLFWIWLRTDRLYELTKYECVDDATQSVTEPDFTAGLNIALMALTQVAEETNQQLKQWGPNKNSLQFPFLLAIYIGPTCNFLIALSLPAITLL